MVSNTEKTTKPIFPVPNWLTKESYITLLKNNFKDFVRIKEFQVEPAVSNGENYMTVLLRVLFKVELADGTEAEISYMTKVLPTLEAMQNMVKTWRIFFKEQTTYRTYIPAFEEMYSKMGKQITFGPRILNLDIGDVDDEVLVMEDLGLRGFKNAVRQEGFDMQHTKAVLSKLAEFHAASACYFESHGPYPKEYDQCLCCDEDLYASHREKVLGLVVDCLSLYEASELKEKLKTFMREAPDIYQLHTNYEREEFRVLNHGDAWANNIMFQYDEDGNIRETYLVDLQMSRYTSPAQDLYYLLLSSTHIDIKLKCFDYFIYYYHGKLTENLKLLKYPKALPTLKHLQISMFNHSVWVYGILTILLPIVLLDKNDNANIENVMGDDDVGNDLKKAMYVNPRYVANMKQLLPWADRRGCFEYSV